MHAYNTKSEDARSGPIRWMDGWTNKCEDRNSYALSKCEDRNSYALSQFQARGPKGLSPATERRGHSFKYISGPESHPQLKIRAELIRTDCAYEFCPGQMTRAGLSKNKPAGRN